MKNNLGCGGEILRENKDRVSVLNTLAANFSTSGE